MQNVWDKKEMKSRGQGRKGKTWTKQHKHTELTKERQDGKGQKHTELLMLG